MVGYVFVVGVVGSSGGSNLSVRKYVSLSALLFASFSRLVEKRVNEYDEVVFCDFFALLVEIVKMKL